MSVTRYIYSGPGMLVGERRAGSPSAYQLDGQGSTAGIVSEAGSRTDSFRFSMLGLQLSRTGSTGTPMQWLAAKGYTTIQGLTDPLYNPPLFGGDSGVAWDPTNLGSLLGKWVQEWLDNLVDGINDLLNWLENCMMSHDPWDCFGGDVHVVNFPPGVPRPMPPAHIPPPPGIPFPRPKPRPKPMPKPISGSPVHSIKAPCHRPNVAPLLAFLRLGPCLFFCGLNFGFDLISPIPIGVDEDEITIGPVQITKGGVGPSPEGSVDSVHAVIEYLTSEGQDPNTGATTKAIVPVGPACEGFSRSVPYIKAIACLIKCLYNFKVEASAGDEDIQPWQFCCLKPSEEDCQQCCDEQHFARNYDYRRCLEDCGS